MIKVLHILSNLSIRSGVTSVVMNYLRFIDGNSVGFSIIYYDEVNTENYKRELDDFGVAYHYFPRKSFHHNLKEFCQSNHGKFDILHIHEPFLAPMFIGIKKKLGVKKVIFHSHSTKMSDAKFKELRNRVLSLPSRFIADNFFACSKVAGKSAFGNKFAKKGFVVYNAINLDKFHFNEEIRNELRVKLGIVDKVVVGHVGNMTPPKNHQFIIKVFSEYLKLNNNAVLMLIGEGYLKNDIILQADTLGIKNHIILVGLVNNVYDYLATMDVFLFPSLFEGLGIALVEAQTNGLRCLFSDVVPKEANIYPAENITMSLKADSSKWARALQKLVGRSFQRATNENYNIKFASKKLEILYSEILGDL